MTVLADAYDAFLFDLDGVLYRGSEVVPGAPEASPDCARRASAWRSSRTTRAGRPRSVAGLLNGFGIAAAARRGRDLGVGHGRTSSPRAASPRRSSWGRRASCSRPARRGDRARRCARSRPDGGRRGRLGSPGGLREALPGIAPGAARRGPVRHERRRLLPGGRRELARRGRAARGHRDDHGRARRGVRQAGAPPSCSRRSSEPGAARRS